MTSGTAAGQAGTKAKEGTASPRLALASLSLAMLLSALGVSSANIGLPALAASFGVSFQAVQWVVLAYLLALTASIVSLGRAADLIGRKRLLMAGIALFTLASVLCGLAPTFETLIAARALQGLGGAAMMALTVAFVGDLLPKARIGSAMGLLGTMSACGTALGPSLGGVLVSHGGWPALFLVNGPLGLAALALGVWSLPSGAPAPRQDGGRPGFDLTGALLLAAALVAFALAMTAGRGHFGGGNLALLGAAVLAGGLFVLAERRAAQPMIRLDMLRAPLLRASLVMNLLVSTVMMATLVVGPFFLARALGLDAAASGLVMATGPVVSALAGVPSGRIVDRVGAGRTVIAALGVMVAGTGALCLLPGLAGTTGYVAALAVLTSGYALFQAANTTAVMVEVAAERRGVVSALLSLSRNLGLIAGASLMGAVFALAAGASDLGTAPPEAIASGMRVTFGVAALLILAALAAAISSRRAPA